MFTRFAQYLKDSKEELKRVNWPTKQQVTGYTVLVVSVSVLVSVFLGSLDFGISDILKRFVF